DSHVTFWDRKRKAKQRWLPGRERGQIQVARKGLAETGSLRLRTAMEGQERRFKELPASERALGGERRRSEGSMRWRGAQEQSRPSHASRYLLALVMDALQRLVCVGRVALCPLTARQCRVDDERDCVAIESETCLHWLYIRLPDGLAKA